jgi:hypothetical protein
VRRQAEYEEERLRAIRERRAAQNPVILATLESHPLFRTLCHNFAPEEDRFVAYIEHKATGKRGLLNYIRDVCGIASHAPIPATWAGHYELGKVPFLPACPTCGKGPIIGMLCQYPDGSRTGGDAECTRHYRWESATNQHFKWVSAPAPRPPGPHDFIPNFYIHEGRWVRWDPATPW